MDNPDDGEWTIINVKKVRKASWEAAKRESAQAGDPMGLWLSDMIDRQVKHTADSILSPGLAPVKNGHELANPVDLPAVNDLLRIAVDNARLSGKPLPVQLRGLLHGLVNQQIRAARGMPAIPYRPRGPVTMHEPEN